MKWNEDELYVLKHGKNELELSWHNGDANFQKSLNLLRNSGRQMQ